MSIQRPPSELPIPPHAKKVFTGEIFDVYQWEQELFDGSIATFEKLVRPDTVVVFPVLDDGRIVLTKQEQPGRREYLGGAGGRVEPGEDIEQAARRELLEETGYSARELVLLDARHLTSKIDWVVYTFIAKGITRIAEQSLDAGEKIILSPMTFDEFLNCATTEKFKEQEIVPMVFRALLDEERMKELKHAFRPL